MEELWGEAGEAGGRAAVVSLKFFFPACVLWTWGWVWVWWGTWMLGILLGKETSPDHTLKPGVMIRRKRCQNLCF